MQWLTNAWIWCVVFALRIGGRLLNVIFSGDCFLFSLATLGAAHPFESFSSAAYRAERFGRWYGHMRPVIDACFWFQPHHCQQAYERAKFNLPEDQR